MLGRHLDLDLGNLTDSLDRLKPAFVNAAPPAAADLGSVRLDHPYAVMEMVSR